MLSDNASPAELACIQQFFACAQATEEDLKLPNGKAQFQSWLAIKSPGDFLGRAISKNKVKVDRSGISGLIAGLSGVLNAK